MLDATLLIDGAPRTTARTFTRRHPVTGDVMTTAAAARRRRRCGLGAGDR